MSFQLGHWLFLVFRLDLKYLLFLGLELAAFGPKLTAFGLKFEFTPHWFSWISSFPVDFDCSVFIIA